MKFTFLGTAAAEGIPARFCECRVCNHARKHLDKNLRRRASYAIDDDILIDLGPDSFWQEITMGVDYLKLRHLIITHPHEDHLCPEELLYRKKGFSRVSQNLNIYGGFKVFTKIMGTVGGSFGIMAPEDLHFTPFVLEHGQSVTQDDLTLLPLNAKHMPGGTPFCYVIERDGKKVLIGNDSGSFPPESWELIAGQQIDFVIMDSTSGIAFPDADSSHQGVNTVLKTVAKLRRLNAIKPDAVIYATHFSHNGGGTHEEYCDFFRPHGINVAYDGLTVNI